MNHRDALIAEQQKSNRGIMAVTEVAMAAAEIDGKQKESVNSPFFCLLRSFRSSGPKSRGLELPSVNLQKFIYFLVKYCREWPLCHSLQIYIISIKLQDST